MKVFNGIIEKTAKKTEFFHRQKKDVFQKMRTVCLKPAHEKSVGANKVRGLQQQLAHSNTANVAYNGRRPQGQLFIIPNTKRLRYYAAAAAPPPAPPQKKRHRLRKRFSGVVFMV